MGAPGPDGSSALDGGDASSTCSTLGPAANDVAAEATPAEPPPASGGTIADGTYHLTHFVFYRRNTPPAFTTGSTLRFSGLVQEYASAMDSLSGNYSVWKARMATSADGTHLVLAECLCTEHGGGCAQGVGTEQPYSVVGKSLWLYERDTNKGGGGDLRISVYEPDT